MTKLFVYVVVLVGVLSVMKILAKKYLPERKRVYKYQRKEFLMSRAEHESFDVLIEIVGDQYYVFPQVHLSALLDHNVVGQNWRGAFSHINGKSVDFVVCDKAYIKPLLAIELDDKTHEREDRVERDGEVERMLNEVGMPLLRIKNHGSFDKEEIKRLIFELIT